MSVSVAPSAAATSDADGVLSHFPTAGAFRRGLRYRYLRCIQVVCKVLRCPCRRSRDWEDPLVTSLGTLPPHTPLALADPASASAATACLRLSGSWRFRLFSDPESVVVAGVEKRDFNDDDWDDVPVPSHWQLLGYEVPIYTNLAYPFASCPCRRPRFKVNPSGVYRRRFRLPSAAGSSSPTTSPPPEVEEGVQYRLLFNGVSAAAHVWLDGELLGYFQDSGTPHELDVTKVLAKAPADEHVLVVRVLKWCDGSYLEDQDTWWLSGIFRDVILYALPSPVAIEDFHIESEVEEPYTESANARLSIQLSLRGEKASVMAAKVQCEVYDDTGKAVASQVCKSPKLAEGRWRLIFNDAAMVASASLLLQAPAKWSPEHPVLYKVVMSLLSGEGKEEVLQREVWHTGVRDVRIKNRQLLLNGRPLLVNGVNRVENHPDYGKAVPEKVIWDDLAYLKRHNFNAVRCSHCPNAPAFYRHCDELGLLVLDEANIENHGFSLLAAMAALQCDPEWRGAYLARVQAMFGRTKNHACVMGWSLGNEAGTGSNTAACADWLRAVDATRYVHYESGEHHGDATLMMGDGRHPLTDIVCPMYASPAQCEKLGRIESRPVILCEYNHAMGNSNGGLHLFYNVFRSKDMPACQGGFIWDFADQGLRVPRKVQPLRPADWFLEGRWGYGGDFGDSSGSGDKWFCCNGLSHANRTPKPAMEECRYLMQSLKFSVTWSQGDTAAEVVVEPQPGADPSGVPSTVIRWTANNNLGATIAEGSDSFSSFTGSNGEAVAHTFRAAIGSSPSGGLWLRLSAELTEDVPYAAKGHVIAHQTVELISPPAADRHESRQSDRTTGPRVCTGVALPLKEPTATQQSVEALQLEPGHWEVATGSYKATIQDGQLVSLRTVEGMELLDRKYGKPLDLSFWRLPTDNDRGGVDVFAPKAVSRFVPPSMASRAALWERSGLHSSSTTVIPGSVSWTSDHGSQIMTVDAEHGPEGQRPLFNMRLTMTFKAEGVFLEVLVKSAAAQRSLQHVKSLPRIGLQFVLAAPFNQISWLGCGPHESYPDRKASAHRNVYRSTVEDMHVPYVVPGECGGRADVQWVAAQDAKGVGLLAQYFCDDAANPEKLDEGGAGEEDGTAVASSRPAGMSGAQICAKRWTPQAAAKAAHDFELPHGEELPVVLHVDTAHCGIGGVGGDTTQVWAYHPWYDIDPCTPEWSFAVKLIPLSPGQLTVQAPFVGSGKAETASVNTATPRVRFHETSAPGDGQSARSPLLTKG